MSTPQMRPKDAQLWYNGRPATNGTQLCFQPEDHPRTHAHHQVFWGGKFSRSATVHDRPIRAWTGCFARVIAKTWILLVDRGLRHGASKERFLYALHVLACYPRKDLEGAARCGATDEKTYRSQDNIRKAFSNSNASKLTFHSGHGKPIYQYNEP